MTPAAAPDRTAVPDGERVLVALRAVNVGGASTLPMADLRAAAAEAGHTDVATHLASGNLLLRPAPGAPTRVGDLEAALTADLGDRLGRTLALTVRTRRQVDEIVAADPFPDASAADPAHVVVLLCDGPVPEGVLDLSAYGREQATGRGRDVHLHYPDGIGRSKVTAAVLDRLTGRRGTARNWRTVLAVQAKLRD
ncbi:DUF1697 domain-containing protein [Cellulomonas triticagri]|uniref:DUF1697 domain-containing protein n=1 Tax=Cellulomonas triticagri TaxID=2483352 RepID=A0A3M2IVN4_9CELL|nr:DUF1697 domain-containing protein [Cellulomonas triticagri]RMI05159.1 DUF1697 domain-containing protein [Cellulomonas triticagri]